MLRRAVVTLLLALSACASIPRLTPKQPQRPDHDDVVLQQGGVQILALPNAWKGVPERLPETFTPIWVHIVNQSDQAYDVTYSAFSLIDEQGRIYGAISPAEVVRATIGEVPVPYDPSSMVASNETDAPVVLAQFGFGIGVGPGYDFANPYDPYSPFNAYNQAYADGARNIVLRGLREGRLLPKTQAAGFVYFQAAYEAKELRLRLEANSEVPNSPPLTVETTFVVAH